MKVKVQLDRKTKKLVKTNIRKYEDRARDAVFKEVVRTSKLIRKDAYDSAPIAFGSLRKGIVDDYNKKAMLGTVESRAKYSIYVEKGRPPGGIPPIDSIKSWTKKKSGVPESAAYPIALKIAKEGTKPQPFMKPAFEKHSKKHFDRVKKALKNLKVN